MLQSTNLSLARAFQSLVLARFMIQAVIGSFKIIIINDLIKACFSSRAVQSLGKAYQLLASNPSDAS